MNKYSNKYRVYVEYTKESWWFCTESSWDNNNLHWRKDIELCWRLTPPPNKYDQFVSPKFWFKPLKERVLIAVNMAVNIIAYRNHMNSEYENINELAKKLTQMAQEAFEKALKEKELN